MGYNSIDWENVSRKETRGFNDVDLAGVPEIKGDYLIIKSGAVNKEVYSILRNLVERFDVHKLLLRATREESETLYRIEE